MLDVSHVAVSIYFEPVITVLLGVTFLGEHFTWQMALGLWLSLARLPWSTGSSTQRRLTVPVTS
jgi:drug/metabolite transporter (DMT)-like permease